MYRELLKRRQVARWLRNEMDILSTFVVVVRFIARSVGAYNG